VPVLPLLGCAARACTPPPPHPATVQDTCPDSLVVLVGNKVDLADERRVSKAEGANLAEAEGLAFYEVRPAVPVGWGGGGGEGRGTSHVHAALNTRTLTARCARR
jgi:hypothetical protein